MKTLRCFQYPRMGTLPNNDLIQDHFPRVEVILESLSTNAKQWPLTCFKIH